MPGHLADLARHHREVAIGCQEGDRVAIHWNFELTDKDGKTRRFDEVALQEWRGDRIFRERFFYDPTKVEA